MTPDESVITNADPLYCLGWEDITTHESEEDAEGEDDAQWWMEQ